MSRKLIAILSVFVVLGLMTTTVFAGFKGRNFDFNLGGSVIVTGTFNGGDNNNVVVRISMSGPKADVTCTNQGNPDNIVPGQNPGEIAATESFTLEGIKNGNTEFRFVVPDPTLTGTEAGCPNDNWTAKLFVYWDSATITVKELIHNDDGTTTVGETLFSQEYECTTTAAKDDPPTPASISCDPIP